MGHASTASSLLLAGRRREQPTDGNNSECHLARTDGVSGTSIGQPALGPSHRDGIAQSENRKIKTMSRLCVLRVLSF